ncbi:MAG: hypothetical protein HY861_01080 [Chlamydiia bacterium]|nr:hypothetical protein [Chlamydiia bacterium]
MNTFLCLLPSALLYIPCALFAMLIGNPGDPALMTHGVFSSPSALCSVRTAFLKDYVYRQKYREEFQLQGVRTASTYAKLSTQAGLVTLNFIDRVDVYGLAGSSCLNLNREIFSEMQLSWGVGGKLVIWRTQDFFLGTDIKYFQTTQEPLFFISNGLAFNRVNDFAFEYNETQVSVGMCYRASLIAPYLYATYLISKIEPNPMTALVRWPLSDILVDAVCHSVVAKRRWGMAVGATVISSAKAALTVESRLFNQNAIDINLDIRF